MYSTVEFESSGKLEKTPFHFAGDLPDEVTADPIAIRLSYHGNSHYNSLASEDLMFPIGARSSHRILQHREACQLSSSVPGSGPTTTTTTTVSASTSASDSSGGAGGTAPGPGPSSSTPGSTNSGPFSLLRRLRR